MLFLALGILCNVILLIILKAFGRFGIPTLQGIVVNYFVAGTTSLFFVGEPYTLSEVIHADFFEHSGQYDFIFEQTFFCALDPSLRERYVTKMNELLKPGGQLAGVMFNRVFEEDGPPFGGTKEEYEQRFSPFFDIKKMELCYNSILPREGNELFVRLQKPV